MGDAMQMVAAVGEKAKGMGVPVTICIKDRHNVLVAHVRMKNAILGSVELACQKATTSALFPAPSSALAEYPALQLSNGIISGVGGALPLITKDGVHVGSIGISGAPSGEMDEELAKIGVDMLDSLLQESCNEDKWTLTGEVPNKLPQTPPAPLGVTYNNNKIVNAQIIPSDNMLKPPVLDWNAKKGELYTIFLIDFGIERLEGLQWVHWLVSNVKDGSSIKQGDEVSI